MGFLSGEKVHSFIPNKFDLLAFFFAGTNRQHNKELLLPYIIYRYLFSFQMDSIYLLNQFWIIKNDSDCTCLLQYKHSITPTTFAQIIIFFFFTFKMCFFRISHLYIRFNKTQFGQKIRKRFIVIRLTIAMILDLILNI